jgi:hypothetical protein
MAQEVDIRGDRWPLTPTYAAVVTAEGAGASTVSLGGECDHIRIMVVTVTGESGCVNYNFTGTADANDPQIGAGQALDRKLQNAISTLYYYATAACHFTVEAWKEG